MNGIRRASLTELVNELERQKRNSVDIVARSDAIVAVPHDDGVTLRVAEWGEFDMGAEPDFHLTQYAHSQLSDKMGIPRRYYDRMKSEGRNQLLADNINAWMSSKEKRLLRVLDGNVRAILSDRYRPIDNYDLLWAFLDTVKQFQDSGHAVQVDRCDVTETHMYIRTMMPAVSDISRTPGQTDEVQAMMLMENSEVGAGRMAVSLGMWRKICSNGLWGEDIVSRVHIGGKLDMGVIEWSEQTLRDTDAALFSQVKDTVRTAMQPELWHGFVGKAYAAAGLPFKATLVEVVDNIAPRYQITGNEKERLLEAFAIEAATPAGKTQWGLANAITRVARDTDDADRQILLEKAGGEVITLSPLEFSGMLEKVTV